MKKKLIITLSIIFVIGLIFGGNYMYNFTKYEAIIPQIVLNDVDLSTIEDGTYTGSFNAYILASEVEVEVVNHEIIDIVFIKHKYERGKTAEVILDKVLAKQSLTVDTVSGATNSSKVILKSIENALTTDE